MVPSLRYDCVLLFIYVFDYADDYENPLHLRPRRRPLPVTVVVRELHRLDALFSSEYVCDLYY
ncbi:hypothetical protein Hdeb2414_s0012g00395671 [Helianthus debilis subsp. tardiflorus]